MNFLELKYNGKVIRLWAEKRGFDVWVHFNGRSFVYEESKKVHGKRATVGNGVICAPMPGKVIRVHVGEGEAVQVGQVIVVMEAMKMEYSLCADISGRIEKLSCTEGGQVTFGQELVIVKDRK